MTIKRIKNRILRKGRGAVFTTSTFLDLGTRASVDQALSRLVKSGFVRRLSRGLYNFPKFNKLIGMLTPAPYEIAKAIADANGYKILPTQAGSANFFGLSKQVPAKPIFYSDGPNRTYVLGKQIIKIRHASAKTMAGAGRISGTVFQALRYIGKKRINKNDFQAIRRVLRKEDIEILKCDCKNTSVWIQDSVEAIAKTQI